jgi:hypothetical protein
MEVKQDNRQVKDRMRRIMKSNRTHLSAPLCLKRVMDLSYFGIVSVFCKE